MTGLLYLYAILEAAAAASLRDGALTGLEQSAVEPIIEGPLAAAVSKVPASEFEEGPLNERVRDLEWLAPRVVAHQQVNADLFDRAGALLPLSFGNVFRDEERVRGLLREQRVRFLEQLDRVRGCAEWVATIGRDSAAALESLERTSTPVRNLREQAAAGPPGRSYLLRRRLDDVRRQELREYDSEVKQELFGLLQGIAQDTHAEPLGETAHERSVARVSLLVPRQAEGRFIDTIERVRQQWDERGYRLEVTGPWPPYRFGGLQPEREDVGRC